MPAKCISKQEIDLPPTLLKSSDLRWVKEERDNCAMKRKIFQLTGDIRTVPLKAQQILGRAKKKPYHESALINEQNNTKKIIHLTGDPRLIPPKARAFFFSDIEANDFYKNTEKYNVSQDEYLPPKGFVAKLLKIFEASS